MENRVSSRYRRSCPNVFPTTSSRDTASRISAVRFTSSTRQSAPNAMMPSGIASSAAVASVFIGTQSEERTAEPSLDERNEERRPCTKLGRHVRSALAWRDARSEEIQSAGDADTAAHAEPAGW